MEGSYRLATLNLEAILSHPKSLKSVKSTQVSGYSEGWLAVRCCSPWLSSLVYNNCRSKNLGDVVVTSIIVACVSWLPTLLELPTFFVCVMHTPEYSDMTRRILQLKCLNLPAKYYYYWRGCILLENLQTCKVCQELCPKELTFPFDVGLRAWVLVRNFRCLS